MPSDGGKVITLEVNEKCVEVAKRNVANAGLEDRIEIIHGKAEESLARLVAENRGPFDLIFIDADKVSNTIYLNYSMKLARKVLNLPLSFFHLWFTRERSSLQIMS